MQICHANMLTIETNLAVNHAPETISMDFLFLIEIHLRKKAQS